MCSKDVMQQHAGSHFMQFSSIQFNRFYSSQRKSQVSERSAWKDESLSLETCSKLAATDGHGAKVRWQWVPDMLTCYMLTGTNCHNRQQHFRIQYNSNNLTCIAPVCAKRLQWHWHISVAQRLGWQISDQSGCRFDSRPGHYHVTRSIP